MEIRHLKYFIEIARYRSFSHAAEAIHVSQPTLSRTVRDWKWNWARRFSGAPIGKWN